MDSTSMTILKKALSILHNSAFSANEIIDLTSTSARIAEVPWVAECLTRYLPQKVLDIGFSLASADYLALLLEYRKMGHLLFAADIIKPSRIKSRYPEQYLDQVLEIPVQIGDIRTMKLPAEEYDMVTLISVIEHVGYDVASTDDPESAFVRAKDPEAVSLHRDNTTDGVVLDRIHLSLKKQGKLLVTVPASSGGPVILKDSLGYYCAQLEYNHDAWQRIIGHEGFELIEDAYYYANEDYHWKKAPSFVELEQVAPVHFEYARGVACAVLQKK